jgi:uncharacterized membrane protein YfcA
VFLTLVAVVAVLSGATASVAGFGIGSILTPLLAQRLGMPAAVAAVSVPHAFATVLRCWRLRSEIDWRVLRTFGILSAVGALIGALLYTRLSSRALTVALAVLLLATAVAGLTNWVRRWHPTGAFAAVFGFASGLFGGLAGNQGGLRAAALFAFRLPPLAFVATSTAAGVLVDAGRMPIYLVLAHGTLLPYAGVIALATAGVLLGTLLGERILLGLSAETFRRLVSILIGMLGIWLLANA